MRAVTKFFDELADLPGDEPEDRAMPDRPYSLEFVVERPGIDPTVLESVSRFLNYTAMLVLFYGALYLVAQIVVAFTSGQVNRSLTQQERAIQQCSGIHDQLLRSYCIAAAEQDGGR